MVFDGLDRVLPSGFGASLYVWFVDLDDVDPSREQILHLGIDGIRVGKCQRLVIGVEIVLRLLRHRERAGEGDLDWAVGVLFQERDMPGLHRPPTLDGAGHARDGDVFAGSVNR
jgi:hypothetical protein